MNRTTPVWRAVWAWSVITAVCIASFALGREEKIQQFAHATWGPDQGVPPLVYAIAQTADDYLWIGSAEGLVRFDGLKFERYRTSREASLPVGRVISLLALPDGGLWIGFDSGAISLLRNDNVINYGIRDGVPAGLITCLAQDQTGTIWAGSLHGLMRLENNRWKVIGREWNFQGTAARALYVDRAGTLWAATENAILYLIKGTATFQSTGIHVGEVAQIAEARNGKLWMAETGRSVRPIPLHTRLAPSDETEIQVGSVGILFARDGDLWITTVGDGLRRVPAPERLKGKIGEFDTSIQSYTVKDGLSSDIGTSVFQDRARNLWVGTKTGLDRFRETSSVDLTGLSANPQAPPSSIESVLANGQTYRRWDDLKLPAGTRNLQIDYTAVSSERPLRALFRYKLLGIDSQWRDAGTGRTAHYENLGPGRYQFRVIAGNLDGAWNSKAAVIDFEIPPFWFQTAWFRVACGVILLALLWMLYQLRVRQLKRQFTLALGSRVDERTRIARELHDTLLQSLHGLMFQFQAARNLLPGNPESAMQTMDEAIRATEHALAESRDAIHGLRPETETQRDLAEMLTGVGQEPAGIHSENGRIPSFRVIVEGEPRRLSPLLQDEIYRIGREVIRNAFHHAAASRVEVEIRYDEGQLRLRIRDDGKGIDPKVVEVSSRPGHWGLPGIRERAQRIGSRLEFWSETGAGTEVELRVPAAMAYENQRNGRRSALFHREGNNGRRF